MTADEIKPEQDELGQLETLIQQMRTALSKMRKDRRYSDDDDFVKGTEKLYVTVQALSSKFTDLETEYMKLQCEAFSSQLLQAELFTDELRNKLKTAATGLEIVGAVEQIAKVVQPWL